MKKYLLSALSLVALTQVTSASTVTYQVTLEDNRAAHLKTTSFHDVIAQDPPRLHLTFTPVEPPYNHIGRPLDSAEGSHTITVPNGKYNILFDVNEHTGGFEGCVKNSADQSGFKVGGKNPLNLLLKVELRSHRDQSEWMVVSCEEVGG